MVQFKSRSLFYSNSCLDSAVNIVAVIPIGKPPNSGIEAKMEVIEPVRANHQTFLRMAYIPPNKENTDNIAKGIAMPIRRDETNSGISSVPGKKKAPSDNEGND